MSLSAAAIRLLADKGLSASDIADVAEANESVRSSAAIRQKRYRDNKRDVTRDVTPSPNERDILTPTRVEKPSPLGEVKKQETLAAIGSCLKVAYPTPSGVTDEQWAAFRSQRKKSLNARSYALLTNKLAKLAEDGWPPGEMIDLAIERGWETVFAPRNFANDRPDRDPTTVALERLIGDVGSHAGVG